jgi:hypothetical protein
MLNDRKDMVLDDYQQDKVDVDLDNQELSIPNPHIKTYHRIHDRLQFGPESVYSIQYIAFDGIFYEVQIACNPSTLSTVFSQVYGPATRSKIGGTFWNWTTDGNQTNIIMLYGSTGRGVCLITNNKLEKKLKAVQEVEAALLLKKSQKDF